MNRTLHHLVWAGVAATLSLTITACDQSQGDSGSYSAATQPAATQPAATQPSSIEPSADPAAPAWTQTGQSPRPRVTTQPPATKPAGGIEMEPDPRFPGKMRVKNPKPLPPLPPPGSGNPPLPPEMTQPRPAPTYDPDAPPPPFVITKDMQAWADKFETVDIVTITKTGGDYLRALIPDFNRERNVINLSSRNPKGGTTDDLFIQAFNRDIYTPKDYVRVKYPDLIIVVHRKYIEAWRGVTIDAVHNVGTSYNWTYKRTN